MVVGRRELRSLQLDQPISALALCADGKTLAVGTITGEILVYDLRGVITPLYSTVALDGSPISSLHFAPAPTDAASSIAPQGQPVVSAEHVSPVEGETVQAIALRKLQALGLGDLLQSTSRPASPTAPRSPSITRTIVIESCCLLRRHDHSCYLDQSRCRPAQSDHKH